MSRLLDVTAEIIDFFVCQKSALYGVVVTVLFSNATCTTVIMGHICRTTAMAVRFVQGMEIGVLNLSCDYVQCPV